MPADELTDAEIADILNRTERVAVVGASANPARPSHQVTGMLIDHGYDVTPVNPGLAGQSIHGRLVVATLADAGKLDMVDVFRASESVGPVVDEAIRLGARTVWMQLGVINQAAAAAGRAAGLAVAMDRCPAIEVPRLGVRKKAVLF
jgi:predicted CoA-binding protein